MKTDFIPYCNAENELYLEALAKGLVETTINDTRDKARYPDGLDFELHIVWKCYVLGNMKFLITSDLPDGKYYEVTYSVDKKEFYLDTYVRVANDRYSLELKYDTGEAPEHVTNDSDCGEPA